MYTKVAALGAVLAPVLHARHVLSEEECEPLIVGSVVKVVQATVEARCVRTEDLPRGIIHSSDTRHIDTGRGVGLPTAAITTTVITSLHTNLVCSANK